MWGEAAADAGRRILFHVASRGHHADIGGITPGSMPPFSTRVEEEGVQIDNFKLVEGGRLRGAEMLALLGGGPYPSRNPAQNIADMEGADRGEREGRAEVAPRWSKQFGLDVVQAYMGHVQ